jgi:hypothetical protein
MALRGADCHNDVGGRLTAEIAGEVAGTSPRSIADIGKTVSSKSRHD